MSTQQRVRDCLVNKLALDESEVTPEANLRNDLGIDSLTAAEAAMALEEEFEIEVSAEDLERQRTVQDVYDYIELLANIEPATAQT